MKFISSKFMTLIILALTLLLSACVGTIEDTSKKTNTSNNKKLSDLVFDGITEAIPMSHNKVRVGFKLASGGSGDFSYLVYLNGNFDNSVAAVDASLVTLDAQDVAHIIVPNLSIGTTYTFAIKVYDKVTEITDTNKVFLNATTFSTEVPNFDGINSLENVAGKSGETSLKVSWNMATPSVATAGGFGGDVHDISGYNIYYGTSATEMTNVIPVSGSDTLSYTLNGLQSDTAYYVKVRAKDSNNPAVEDGNLEYLVKKTLTTKPISFGGVASVEIPTDSTG